MNELTLEIKSQKLGVLTTNAQEILDQVREMLPKYKAENYTEANLDDAKADKATLNKLKKALNDERIRLEKEFMVPFVTFKELVNAACDEIGKAVTAIDGVVKAVDVKAKEERQKMIDELWKALNWTVIPLAAVQRPEWMVKATSRKTIANEMKVVTTDIDSNIALLKDLSHPDDFEAVRLRYIQTLNAQEATRFAVTLKTIRAQAAATKAAAESVPAATTPAPVAFTPSTGDGVAAVSGAPTPLPTLIRTLKIEGTKDQLKALAEFMKERGIKFWKVET